MTVHEATGRGTRWLSGVVALAGAGCLGVGIWKVYFSPTTPRPSPVLLLVGALLLVSPALLHRRDGAGAGPAPFELQMVQDIADLGAPKAAALLDQTELARLVESYIVIREELDEDDCRPARIRVQDSLVRQAAGFACRHQFDPAEVKSLFPKAAPVVRVLLIALMKGDPRLLDGGVLASAIAYAASRNERFHALQVAQWHWARIRRLDRTTILGAIETAYAVISTDDDVRVEADKVRALATASRPTSD